MLRIGQRATLTPMVGARAYGMLMALTHHDIAQLYAAPELQHDLPEAVSAQTMEGQAVPARCYNLAEPPRAAERNPAYAAQLKAVLQGFGFPAEYVVSIQESAPRESRAQCDPSSRVRVQRRRSRAGIARELVASFANLPKPL